MVPAMSALLRSARLVVLGSSCLALVLGISGVEGSIHSIHHLPAQAHAHDEPGGAPDESCPMAAAALHLAATEVAALPALDPSPAESELVAPRSQNAPRIAWREPGSGRAPPLVRSLPS
jgi:hypothetical protein